ncbi:hypothetical protein BGZ60DRAFT_118957 [Tricladium varicosporioides]|nr:hypothetical protein BGZ60DRAFT_118957 [Hymenoscyphus varicosporioides]
MVGRGVLGWVPFLAQTAGPYKRRNIATGAAPDHGCWLPSPWGRRPDEISVAWVVLKGKNWEAADISQSEDDSVNEDPGMPRVPGVPGLQLWPWEQAILKPVSLQCRHQVELKSRLDQARTQTPSSWVALSHAYQAVSELLLARSRYCPFFDRKRAHSGNRGRSPELLLRPVPFDVVLLACSTPPHCP